ncbi:MAG: hypothetical protein EON98_11255, partial [Chitinophagaceae bacterium]
MQPIVALGKSGSNFLLLHRNEKLSEIWSVNSQNNLLAKKTSPLLEASMATHILQGENMTIIQQIQHEDTTEIMVSVLSEMGDVILNKRFPIINFADETTRDGAFLTAESSNGRFHVFYKCLVGLATDSLLFKGTIVDENWKKIKEVSFLIPYEDEFDVLVGVLPDESGNVHLVTGDRYDNFKLSTRLRIHTINVQKELMTSDEITIKSRKLKDFILEEDTATKNLELTAVYIDSKTKNASGLFFMTAATNRGVPAKADFYEFEKELATKLVKAHKGAKADKIMNELVVIGGGKTKNGVNLFSVLPQQNSPFPAYSKSVPNPIPRYTRFPLPKNGSSRTLSPPVLQNGLSPLSTEPNVPSDLRQVSENNLSPISRNRPITFTITQVLSFRFLDDVHLQKVEWGKIKMEGSLLNNLVPFSNDSITYVTYLANEFNVPYLAKVQFTENGQAVTSSIPLEKSHKLLLSQAQKLDETTYFV